MFKISLLCLLLGAPNVAAFCFDEAGSYYGINPKLLKAIATVESDLKHQAINQNKNKSGDVVSVDYGLMQINSTWFSRLSKFNVTPNRLLNESCFNVNIGAWILSQNFATHGYNWNSIGAYNAGFSKKNKQSRARYIIKIQQALSQQ